MNRFSAVISEITSFESIHMVRFSFEGESLTMISFELPKQVREGLLVKLCVKPSHIALAKEFSGSVSFSNLIKAKIEKIEEGKIACSVICSKGGVLFQSIITQNSKERMNLALGDEVALMIKASELSIVEMSDD